MISALHGRLARRAAFFVFTCVLLRGQPDALIEKSRLGKELMGAGRFAEAVAVYEELVRALPDNTGLHLNLGLALEMSGRQREAIPQFEHVLKSDPGNVPALTSLGACRLAAGDPARAVAPLEKLVSVQPSNIDARGMLANAMLAAGRAGAAAPHFRALTAGSPADPKAWYGLGRAYETLAASAFEELSKAGAGSPEWLALVAESRLMRGQYRSAFFFYRQAIAKQPAMRGIHAGIAAVYFASGHPDWAEAEQKKELQLGEPDCAREAAECDFAAGRLLRAAASKSLYWQSKAYNELARRAFAQLGRLPESIELHALKAELMANHGQYLQAAEEWRAALRAAPGDPRLQRELITALYLGRSYTAVLPLLESVPAASRPAELHYFLGDSLLHLERVEEALPHLEAAVKADPKLLPAHASLGLSYTRVNKNAEAIPHLIAALAGDEDGSLHYQLARAYQATGNAPKARETMAAYQKIRDRNEAGKRDLEEQAQITAPSP